ncbi:hypothetical protein K2173_021361 [Erythroxylum novogranatense]|uniref:(S)-hydroxynitrile lyase n=1 Tax=Erythroxylum novogranatense TaxID=1862640 RepID=A0AAV8TXV4_9ROSI|nr:hypothetical protein K2173_021361 [Erythroxylum novogranatense]
MARAMHFVLVHGTCHGAWCWYKIVALLKSAGHRVTAVDLGASGVNPKRFNEVVSVSDYASPLMEFMTSLHNEDEKVILVGHSYGGMSISLAMESFPDKVLVAVYLTAFMPSCVNPPAALGQEVQNLLSGLRSFSGKQFFKRTATESLLDSKFFYDDGAEQPPTSALFGPQHLGTNIYQNCPLEDLELAKTLIRPSGLFLKELGNTSLLTEEKFGSVDRVYIICEEDKLIKKDLQEWFIENSPTKDVKLLAGADHMAMLSKPKELYLCLQEIAEQY